MSPLASSGRADGLRLLAERRGIATSYEDAFGRHHEVGRPTLFALLQALGEPLERPEEAARLLAAAEAGGAGHEPFLLPPVLVAWEGELDPVALGPVEALRAVTAALALEDGNEGDELIELVLEAGAVKVRGRRPLPYGLHKLVVDRPGRAPGSAPGRPSRLEAEPDEVTVISSPRRAPGLVAFSYGAALPLYGLEDEQGGGHLGLLARTGELLAAAGASYLATLPLLAAQLEEGDFPSPYSPFSRLFWNEGYLDPSAVPELSSLTGGLWLPRGSAGRARALRPHLAAAAAELQTAGGRRLEEYRAYLSSRPELLGYARYRAACEERGADRAGWPARWRRGLIGEEEVDPRAVAAHCYGQFAFESQLGEVSSRLERAGIELMLDLPLGSGPAGYDTWAFPEVFADGVHIGAPPDRFFAGGQDWGFAPQRPASERALGYPVTTACLRNLLAHCKALRIDHAPGLSRLWWIPAGMPPTEGAYVSYPTEELLALHCLEAWRAGACLVGENLGTVQESLTTALVEHGIAGMRVAIFDLESERSHPMEPLEVAGCEVAMVDTHDTATFAGWFASHDVDLREHLGLLGGKEASAERRRRKSAVLTLVDRLVASGLLAEPEAGEAVAVHRALLAELGRSEAALVLVNLEDCWGELEPQNLPGSGDRRENFSRRLGRRIEEMDRDGALSSALAALGRARGEARAMARGDGGY